MTPQKPILRHQERSLTLLARFPEHNYSLFGTEDGRVEIHSMFDEPDAYWQAIKYAGQGELTHYMYGFGDVHAALIDGIWTVKAD